MPQGEEEEAQSGRPDSLQQVSIPPASHPIPGVHRSTHSEQTRGLVANDESNFNRSIVQPDRLREMDAQIECAQNWLLSEGWWWRIGKRGLGRKARGAATARRRVVWAESLHCKKKRIKSSRIYRGLLAAVVASIILEKYRKKLNIFTVQAVHFKTVIYKKNLNISKKPFSAE